ncbi:DUF6630 family protein [Staphylospora marina]|uniref:DUF6630 family protein n=1 Tax=Staphylospora marina TaxID=2490858 RepID=UPI000F5B9575|nr:hypothetical protein [Staphylospora marina]
MRYDPEKLLQLCRHMLPGDLSLTAEVRLAIEKPILYLTVARKDVLAGPEWERWRPTRSLPWFALLRGLRRRRLLFTWNDLTPDAHARSRFMRWAWVIRQGRLHSAHSDFLELDARRQREWFLRIATRELDALGYALCELSPSLSPMTLTVLDRETALRCSELAAESGYGVIEICPGSGCLPSEPVTTWNPACPH